MKLLAIKIGFLGNFFTRAQMVVHSTVVQESRQQRGRNPTIQTLGDKSWDNTEEILGQCSLGTVMEQFILGTVLGQYSLGTVLGQCSLRTVSGQSSLGSVVLGQWSWDSGLGTVVLGQ